MFIIVLRATCLVDLPLSPNNPCNFKENIIDNGNRQVLLLKLRETKTQSMTINIVRILGVGRFLKWGAVNARETIGRVLVF